MLAKEGAGKFRAFSAGSHPKEQVNPLAIATLEKLGYPTDGLRSKSWDEFEAPDAPSMDFVITVCDNAAGEVCPIWPGHPVRAHWGVEDPAAAKGSRDERLNAFATAARHMKNRIAQLILLPRESLNADAARALNAIGQSEGASTGAVSLGSVRVSSPEPP